MEIKFNLTKKDYWNYNCFSVVFVKNLRKIFIGTPVLIFTITMAVGLIFKLNMLQITAIALGIPAVYMLTVFIPMFFGIMKISSDKLTEQTLVFNDEKKQLHLSALGKTSKYSKENIQLVKQTKNYIFITMHTFSAIIIPKSTQYDICEIKNILDRYIMVEND